MREQEKGAGGEWEEKKGCQSAAGASMNVTLAVGTTNADSGLGGVLLFIVVS